ncbi:class I SAM-dependent RNA methyltransferase [Brevibacterium marinum]|uniref:tRNA/tmRNA/rRNA uracil-C5-methylase (TrmA/RlmC/RlmD family) n=1 Tax=Brevibacterium marinum TaxID=418643 RepID=A0A846RZ49_9MICO|nr:methyltransferase [Brevibacterium marinum]NJC57206.1 tRNA/tmRNA/rRNA uracil-C5-methylase (TrmA/RlmC/RlmD family) [Brevibacterium marinum]
MSAPSAEEIPAMDLTLHIESPAAGGTSIARHEGQVVFVTGAIPGETVRARTEAGPAAKFLRADVTEVIEASDFRITDRRRQFLTEDADDSHLFGGMEFAHVDLAHSRELKAEVLGDQLSRIGHIDREVEVAAAPGESTGLNWRTRVQLAVDADGRLGMLAPRSHDVVPLASAPLATRAIAEVALTQLRLPGADRLEFAWSGDRGAVIVRGDADPSVVAELAQALPTRWSVLADARSGTGRRRVGTTGGHTKLSVVRGDDQLIERVSGRDFRVAADGFWQVHEHAPQLLSAQVNSALSEATRMVTDLYCGVGLLGISAASATGARLYGVEGAKSAIENAKVNAKGLKAAFDATRADRVTIPNSDVIILDPPRSGAGKAVARALLDSNARTIVYVSCDAATLARDLAILVGGGFAIESLRGFDLFPLTAHLETVTVLRR